MSQQHNIVIGKLIDFAPRSVLNIGMRSTSNLDVYRWCAVNRIIFCQIEIHVPNCDFILSEHLGFLQRGDVHERFKTLPQFDVVLWMHGPEHLTLQHLGEVLDGLDAVAQKGIVLQMPEREETTPYLHGNPWERHLSYPPREYWSGRGYDFNADAAAEENTATYIKCK